MQVKPATAVDAEQFISTLRPALAHGKMCEALETVKQHWTVEQLIGLLSDRSGDVRKVAALALGLAGDARAIKPLAIALHDKDAMVHQMAEHALWLIWFRSGKESSTAMLREASVDLGCHRFDMAVEKLTRIIKEDPTFAEAYNQRAIAHYLAERYEESIADCRETLNLMPQHFGAMAGMGHCYAHLCKLADARKCYRLALAINPRLEGVEASLAHLGDLKCGPCGES